MSFFLRQIVQNIARKAAANPALREKASSVARDLVEEGKQVAREKDRAYAAGKAFRRVFDNAKK